MDRRTFRQTRACQLTNKQTDECIDLQTDKPYNTYRRTYRLIDKQMKEQIVGLSKGKQTERHTYRMTVEHRKK